MYVTTPVNVSTKLTKAEKDSKSLSQQGLENVSRLCFQLTLEKHIMRYLNEPLFEKNESSNLIKHSDTNYAGDLGDRKLTPGYPFKLSGTAVSLSSEKAKVFTII